MPSYSLIPKVTTLFSRIKAAALYAFLKQESGGYVLLESGGRIIIGDNSPTSISKPTTNYASINKPA